MKSISLKEGRVNQKIKTRTRILNAAKTLMSKNRNTSMEEVANEAMVSRATIYRYFPSLDLLCTEASLDIHYLSPEELVEKVKDKSLEMRIFYIQNYYNQLAQDHELIFRRYLSAVLNESITTKKKIRGARRIDTMNLVLESFTNEMSKKDLKRLKNLASILMGIDSLIVAKDVCGLTNEESNDTLKWGIEMVLKGINGNDK
jgi:AcrR family transcriptional regulator